MSALYSSPFITVSRSFPAKKPAGNGTESLVCAEKDVYHPSLFIQNDNPICFISNTIQINKNVSTCINVAGQWTSSVLVSPFSSSLKHAFHAREAKVVREMSVSSWEQKIGKGEEERGIGSKKLEEVDEKKGCRVMLFTQQQPWHLMGCRYLQAWAKKKQRVEKKVQNCPNFGQFCTKFKKCWKIIMGNPVTHLRNPSRRPATSRRPN